MNSFCHPISEECLLQCNSNFSTVLDNIDVNRFGTRYTLYNTYDGSVIVNTTSSLSDFYTLWNRTSHQSLTSGFNLAAVVKQLRVIGTGLLEEARAQTWSGGRSFISLVVPQLSAVNEADSNYVIEQLYYLREVQPDMTLLFWASGSVGRFASYVVDQNRDLFQFTTYGESASSGGQEVYTNALRVIQRIQSGMANKTFCNFYSILFNFLYIFISSKKNSESSLYN